jgi:hypothetical protein
MITKNTFIEDLQECKIAFNKLNRILELHGPEAVEDIVQMAEGDPYETSNSRAAIHVDAAKKFDLNKDGTIFWHGLDGPELHKFTNGRWIEL